MLKNFFGFFKEPPAAEPITDGAQVDSMYKKWRWRIFYSCFIGYTMFYVCKKNITIALPSLANEYHYTNTQLGYLGSSLYLTYAIGKFVNGVLADSSDVRKFLPTALIMTGLCNICFGLSAMFITPGQTTFFGLPAMSVLLWLFVFFWGASGWFQSMGFPGIAKSLTYWYSNSERGTKWSLWSSSHQLGTFLSVILSGYIIAHFGWKGAFFIPGLLAVLTAIWLYNRMRDRPKSLGLPSVETYRNEPDAKESEAQEEDSRSYFTIFKQYILFNPTIWMLAIAYVFVYIVRFGTEDWLFKYLVDVKKDSIIMATNKTAALPLFGILGAISAGWISDKIFRGKRAPVNLIFLVGVALSIVLLAINTVSWLDFVYMALIGAFTAGPHVLIGGLCAVESSSKKVASASTGFTGIFGYAGAFMSAVGTGKAIDTYGWNGALIFWIASAVVCFVICGILLLKEKKKA